VQHFISATGSVP